MSGDTLAQARKLERLGYRLKAAQLAVRNAVVDACNNGLSETRAAELVGVDRSVIRRWMGKQR